MADKQPSIQKIMSCLLIDSDEIAIYIYKKLLKQIGVESLDHCNHIDESKKLLSENNYSCILVEFQSGKDSTLKFLKYQHENSPDIPILVFSNTNNDKIALSCTKAGAFDFFVKPFNQTRLLTSLKNAFEHFSMKREISDLSGNFLVDQLKNPEHFESIITSDSRMHRIFKYVEAVSSSFQPILIAGESGTGKELISKAIHLASGFKGKLVSVNAAGLDDTMFSDALFGHAKGAYTGAESVRKGLVEEAANGTLFLDEIGDLELKSQVKLLRLLQEREYYPIGSDRPKISKTRVIAATNADLSNKVKQGDFRKDLFFRLKSHTITIPPLRERRSDILILFQFFLKMTAKELNIDLPHLSPEMEEILFSYSFPGNIRELEAVAHDLVYRSSMGEITIDDLKSQFDIDILEEIAAIEPCSDKKGLENYTDIMAIYGHFPTLEEVDNFFIGEALSYCKQNQSMASKILGISQSKISRWVSANFEKEDQ